MNLKSGNQRKKKKLFYKKFLINSVNDKELFNSLIKDVSKGLLNSTTNIISSEDVEFVRNFSKERKTWK